MNNNTLDPITKQQVVNDSKDNFDSDNMLHHMPKELTQTSILQLKTTNKESLFPHSNKDCTNQVGDIYSSKEQTSSNPIINDMMILKENKEISPKDNLEHGDIFSFDDKEKKTADDILKKSLMMEVKLAQLKSRNSILNMKKQYVNTTDMNPADKLKIRLYFRNQMSTFSKHVDNAIKKFSLLTKTPKISKSKIIQSKETSQNQMINTNVQASINNNNNRSIEPSPELMDDIWKSLKRAVATRSVYKFRDAIHFEKKLQSTLKSLPNKRSPKFTKSPRRIDLGDKEDISSKQKPKTSSSSDYPHNTISKNIDQFDPNVNVFIILGKYDALRKALLNRGWVENPDPNSNIFNLKWTLKKADSRFSELLGHQIVNHFEKNASITTKVGLARNIRNLIWFDEDVDYFYPRCYDLNDLADFDDFIEDFKYTSAYIFLKSFDKDALPTGENLELLKLKLIVSMDICERHLKSPDELISMMFRNQSIIVTQNEWNILTAKNFLEIMGNYKQYEEDIKKLEMNYKVIIENSQHPSNIFDSHLLTKIEDILNDTAKMNPQHSLNGKDNIWIIKPAGLSRGRGINCYNNLHDILDNIQVKDSEWVAQKYIENPLIIYNKKFDIRQWVLVTDWNPLTIWFYDECYIRFSADDYDPNNLGNIYAHLTNNSIAKYSENFEESKIEGNMWTCHQFDEYLKKISNRNEFYDHIQPRLKEIVIKSLQSVKDMIENRKNSFEIYGYDFMVDNHFRPWLIEVNSSPAMDYSTHVTERLVKMVLEDIVKVVVDFGMSKSTDRKLTVNTGGFKCIYEGKTLQFP